MAGNSPHGGGFPGAGDDFDPTTLPPRTRPFIPGRYRPAAHVLPRAVFRHFTSFDERAPMDLLLREPEQHLSHDARERERFGERIDLYEEARGKYIVDRAVLAAMQKHAVVMHPLPRLDEITVDVDADPRAAYFRQAKNGLYIRMALLKLLLVGW
ncbi:hypothetical protein TEA_008818 [Camellia sinensis var. sinensis]|uniref:Aspartate/ornithine carbamoyltransferase Asp/Orn-binding domain-containing protein n=1 Tax=Camellia sinensis var. sinensis TaxID=542762 RepID=A0A4S4DLV1_CAMSN|nr:hypothetical protein TEA_008818 [Camellia sinensis var. sinensis]